ncbi:hypothetical protein ACFWF7_15865 [Nocardia sp. NPDC060256]|uniref:hypothetical protein n=1 Tax=unclassified Nocardia TaxID=2637762 RepID=UPI00364916E6
MRFSRFTGVRWSYVPALAVVALAAFAVPTEAAALPAVCVTDSCADVPQGEQAARTGEPDSPRTDEGALPDDEGALEDDVSEEIPPPADISDAEMNAGDPADEDSELPSGE